MPPKFGEGDARMFMQYALVTALALSLSTFLLAQPPEKKDAADDPEKALSTAIKLLESKDHIGFINRFMPPAVLAELLEKHDIAQIAKKEVDYRAEKWLSEFKLVRGTKPVFNNERTIATFNAKDADGKSVRVAFILKDGKWYLK